MRRTGKRQHERQRVPYPQRRWPYPDGMILGNRYSLMDCLMCDKQGPHYLYSADRDDVFQCDQCFAMFTDDSPKWFE